MIRRTPIRALFALLVAASLAGGCATRPAARMEASGLASGCPTSQPPPLPAGQTPTISIETPKGAISVKVEGDRSPIAAGNLVALAACGFYDGVVFHRVVPGFVIQGGDGQFGRKATFDARRVGSGGPGYTIKDEAVHSPYHRGTVAMARTAQPDSQGSQFFIVLDDAAGPTLAKANTYSIVGDVTAGMEVVDAIAAAADAEAPTNPVEMTRVTVEP
ncbi:MAG: peptidylprolyl isomerase [Chloroflexota bacterium]